MPKYITAVYTINDEEAFTEEMKRLKENFKSSEGEPWAISAMSVDHEVNRLALIEEASEEGNMDLIETLISSAEIGNKPLDSFRA